MSSSRRGLGFWVSAWWPVAVGVAVIAVESTKYFGADRTSHPLRVLFEALFGPVGDARWQLIHHYIRKSGVAPDFPPQPDRDPMGCPAGLLRHVVHAGGRLHLPAAAQTWPNA